MSQLDDLLSRSRAPGAFVERKRFSLSRAKAIEKLREFTLRNPRQYVLELVQAAVFSGATYIAIDVDHEHMLLAWVGSEPLKVDALEQIFDYLFADRGARDTRPLVQLAIGLNAVLQRKPKVLRIESGDGTIEGTVRMDLDKRGNGSLGRPSDPLAGTYILAEFGASWLKRFQGDSWTPEEGLVEAQCRYTPVPILLNGRAPFGWKASRSIKWFGGDRHRSFDDGERRGVVALPDPTSESRSRRGFELVVGGVRITRTALPELGELPPRPGESGPVGLAGVICDDNLRKTADQSDIVRDLRYARMLHAVQPTATRVIEGVAGRGYVPPRLPEIDLDADLAAEPLPDPLDQLAPRGPLLVEDLATLPEGAPCFAMDPADAAALARQADPSRFPYPVLLLTPGQVETLDRRLPQVAVHRLGSPADIEFVRRALEQRVRARRVTLPPQDGLPGEVSLTVVLDGPRQVWSAPTVGDTAARITHRGLSLWAELRPLGLPGLCAALELDRADTELTDGLQDALLDVAVRESWRLLPGGASPVEEEGLRRFAIGLLSAHARPHFVRAEAGPTRVSVHLPVGWGAVADAVRTLPLARTAQGPLTLERLASLQGSAQAVDLTEPGDLPLLEPLEERLGFGHLRTPALYGLFCVVAHTPEGWRPVGAQRWDTASVDEVLALSLCVAGPPDSALPEGWERVEAPPMVAHLRRVGVPSSEPLPGLALLHQTLDRLDSGCRARELQPKGVTLARVEAAVRLARMGLAHALGRLEREAVLRLAASGRRATPKSAVAWPDFAVSARHGAALDEEHTALLSLDELHVLEDALEERPRLRFDDAPHVWEALADADPSHWLVRTEVRIPGLRGWLGLRLPFDQTSGVFIQGSHSLTALTDLDRHVPVHGLLWPTGSVSRPTRQQRELLELARQQLYQDLATLVGESLDDDRAAAVRRYALAYTAAAWRQHGGALLGTAALLADRVSVLADDGAEWGSLRRVLEASPEERPAAVVRALGPTPVAARSRTVEEGARALRLEARLGALASRLEAAAGPGLSGARLALEGQYGEDDDGLAWLHDAWGDRDNAVIAVHLGHPLAIRLDRGDRQTAELVLLECARLLAVWARRFGRELDLLAMQRVLVAQRVG